MCSRQLIGVVFIVALAAEYCSAIGLLSGLGLLPSGLGYNPLMGGGLGYPPAAPPPGLGLSLGSRFAISKIPSLGLGCPSTCCLMHSKPCLATKLLLLKKKLMEKKMMMGCGCKHMCGHHHGCGCGLM